MIVLGRIIAPYGVRGWLKLKPFGDDPDSWGGMPQWWLAVDAAGDDWRAFDVAGLRRHGAGWIAKLGGVDDRNGAEGLSGRFVAAPRAALPPPAGNEFYWGDLLGLAVVNEQDEALGRVVSLLETGAHPVLQVRHGELERLLPFVADVVRNVDVTGGVIRVAWAVDW